DQCHTRTARRRRGSRVVSFRSSLHTGRPDNSSLHDIKCRPKAGNKIRKQKSAAEISYDVCSEFWLLILVLVRAPMRFSKRAVPYGFWWSQTGSNRRPPACKAGALPTELWPLTRTTNGDRRSELVGLDRLERSTSPLSGVRSTT